MTSRVSTANVDALSSFASSHQPKLSQPLRRGTWTVEEEQYVAALIEEFKHGHLPLKEGMSLRCFLAKMVHCNPKRISKKFEGSNYNGKQLYEQSDKELDPDEAHTRRTKLQALENKFEESVAALKAAEDSRKTGLESSLGTSSTLDRISLLSASHQRRPLFAGSAGLTGSGVLGTESSWLRSAMATSGGMNLGAAGLGLDMGLGGLDPLARGMDPVLLRRFGATAAAEPKPWQTAGLTAGGLRDMVRLSNNLPIGMDNTSEVSLLKNTLSAPSLALHAPLGVDMASLRSGAGSLVGGGLSSGLHGTARFPSLPGLPSSLSHPGAAADAYITQELLHQKYSPLTPSAVAQLSHDDEEARLRVLMSQQSEAQGPHSKRPGNMMGAADDAKKRRLH